MRINHSKLFADRENHVNGIEIFWSQAKWHLRKFNGIKRENFYWFLKEYEWRFDGENYQQLFNWLKREPAYNMTDDFAIVIGKCACLFG